MTNTTPAAVKRFDYCIHESEMLPFDAGEFVQFTDYAAIFAQLEAANQRIQASIDIHNRKAWQAASMVEAANQRAKMLADSVAKARAEGKVDGLREAADECELRRQGWLRPYILALIPADTPAAKGTVQDAAMSNAPETIWACPCHVDDWNSGNWDLASDGMPNEAEYRRADLPLTTAQLEADPRVRALVEALERIAHASDIYGVEANAEDQGAETLAYAHKSTCNLARAALAQLKEPKL